MTEALTLRRGTAAEELLQNEAFVTCINELYNQYTDEIVKSPIDAKERRENLFFQIRGLQDLTAELTSWVQLKDQLLTPFEE